MTTQNLSSIVIEVGNTSIEIPTIGIHKEDLWEELLAMNISSCTLLNDQFIQRIHDYRWIIYDSEQGWFSIRLIN